MRIAMTRTPRGVNACRPRAARATLGAVLDLSEPFVLLDDARAGGAASRLYRGPVEVVAAAGPNEVAGVLERARAGSRQGLSAAGLLTYEATAAFEPSVGARPGAATPVAWFGLFDGWQEVDPMALLPDPAGARVLTPAPLIERAEYDRRIARVLELIAAGDVYQANLTFQAAVRFLGDPLALYAAVRGRAAAGWGAIVWTGEQLLLSFSPELFFALEERTITCRPMKGTGRRGATPAADDAAARGLAADAKTRAENLMIVDLIRNDLSRVGEPGSVAVPALFEVERYPTVLQMTSSVTARLAGGRDAVDVLAAAFPCGSITGAPKLRAMEALNEIEATPRGLYTGTIGRIDADGSAQFNVAIRTLTVGSGVTTMGLGGGIVADSRPDDEWDEALAKGAFLTAGQRRVDLIETMAFDPHDGIALLDRHFARLGASAEALGFRFDRHAARNELQAATFRLRTPCRLRLLLAETGKIAIEVGPMPAIEPLTVAVVPLPVASTDWRLRHKTSDRAFYDAGRRLTGTAEVVFEDAAGFLTEGSFTNVFVERAGMLVTPPLARGLLPGVLRAELIDSGRAVEGELTRADLTGRFFVGNAVRGLVPAIVAVANGSATPL
ncbi:aminodeoxychorismate synthase component I [Sphingomonas bacterium]|uniref:aminodeoxychorismate synthase component I n=1 Tax=Sphingomonas bacterium TaxID=1895847 RepID=UPI00260C5BAB|nr:aminodeoxychorismate synthase component I [Sphingomonas bacterium]